MRNTMSKGMKATIGIIAVVLVLILAAGVIFGLYYFNRCLFGHDYDETGVCTRCGKEKPDEVIEEKKEERDARFVVEPHNTQLMSLSIMKVAAQAENQKTVTASVMGLEYPKLDWTVTWGEESQGEQGEVAQYVTVTPESDGALSATITCLKPFTGIILVNATLRGTDTSSFVIVSFEGKASQLKFGESALVQSDGYYNVSGVQKYEVPLQLDNYWHQVGKEGTFQIVSITKKGSLNLVERTVYVFNGAATEKSASTKNFSEYKRVDKEEFISFSISGSNLVVDCKHVLSGSFESSSFTGMAGVVNPMDSYVYTGYVKSVATTCYYEVIVKDTLSQVQATIKVGFGGSALASVSFDTSGIVF